MRRPKRPKLTLNELSINEMRDYIATLETELERVHAKNIRRKKALREAGKAFILRNREVGLHMERAVDLEQMAEYWKIRHDQVANALEELQAKRRAAREKLERDGEYSLPDGTVLVKKGTTAPTPRDAMAASAEAARKQELSRVQGNPETRPFWERIFRYAHRG